MSKKYTIEIFDVNSGKWEDKLVTKEELEEMTVLEQENIDELKAEFEIVQKSIAMQLGQSESKSMD